MNVISEHLVKRQGNFLRGKSGKPEECVLFRTKSKIFVVN